MASADFTMTGNHVLGPSTEKVRLFPPIAMPNPYLLKGSAACAVPRPGRGIPRPSRPGRQSRDCLHMWPRPAPPRAVSHGPSRAPQRHPACVYTQTGRNSGQQDQSAYFSVVRRLWNDPKMIQTCSKLRNWVHKCRYREQITYVSCGLLTWIMSCMFVISGSMALWQWHQWDNYLYNDCRECETVTESQWSSWWCLPAVSSPAPALAVFPPPQHRKLTLPPPAP